MPNRPIFDTEILSREAVHQLWDLDDGAELIGQIMDFFTSETPGRLVRISDSLEAGDAETLAQVAHSLKSSSGNIGALALYEACVTLEASARNGELDQLSAVIEEAKQAYDLAVSELSKFVSQ